MIKESKRMDLIARGEIVAGYRSISTGKFTPVLEQKNLVLHGGADIVARLLSGDSRYAINGMYFKFKNTTDPIAPEIPSRSDTVDQYHSITGTDNIDWLRVPIITSGKIAAVPEGSHYSGNSVTFVATTASVSQTGKSAEENPFGDANNSKIFSVALVSMPSTSSITGDVAFSMSSLTTAIAAIPDSYIDVFWTVILN